MRGLLFVVLAACGSDPANVAGDYTVALTDGDNGCLLGGNFTKGNQVSGIDVTITQSGTSATALVGGLAGAALTATIGSNSLSGSVDGDQVTLTHEGTVPQTSQAPGCVYTINAEIDATLTNDALAGQVRYTAADNGGSGCPTIHGCVSTQDFSGSRPPP
ncbi:MAG TPA: hypothetical protein VGO00_26905 [Kofleriaceae bacterium]|nr:hypothetical protein [Kofleriaceae bacterium]